MAQKQIPAPVKVISVLYFIGAIYYFLYAFDLNGGFRLDAGVDIISSVLRTLPYNSFPGIAGLAIIGGILGLAVLEFFVAKGMWKGRNWAKISVIIFSIIGISMGVISWIQHNPVSSVFTLLSNGLITGYLLLSRKA